MVRAASRRGALAKGADYTAAGRADRLGER
jgi:hypothetical protein